MAVKTDINHLTIDVQELPGATRVISTAAWYNNFRYWCCCGIEVVADASQSSASELYLYAHVFDWIDARHSGSVASFYPYAKYGGTQYDSSHISQTIRTHQIYSPGGNNKIFTDGDSGLPWEYYFPLGTFSSGTVTTKGAQTGWMPVSGGAWSGAEGRSDGTVGSPVSASYTVQTVTVSYDGNEGNGSVPSQSRVVGWEGSQFGITLAENAFSRTNYAFVKWNTQADGLGDDYYPGDYYTGGNVKLYAIWRQLTSTIVYYENIPSGASGVVPVPATQTKQPGVAITLSSSVPNGSLISPPYNFVEWNTAANGAGTAFQPGDTYTRDINLNLYAIWQSDYTKSIFHSTPIIRRVDSHGTSDITGEYLEVSGTVRIYPINGVFSVTPSRVIASWSQMSDPNQSGTQNITTFVEATPSGETRYKVYSFSWISSSAILGSGQAYGVSLRFYDSYMLTYSITPVLYNSTISVAFVTMSTNGRGKTMAIGGSAQPSVQDTGTGSDGDVGRLDVYMNTYFWGTTNIALATDQTPGIVRPDNTSITVNNGVISGLSVEESSDGSLWDYYINTSADNWTGHNIGWKQEKWSDGRLVVWMWDWYGFASGAPGLTRNEIWNWKSLLENDSLSLPQAFSDTPTWTISCFARPYSQSTIPQVVYTITGFSNNTSIDLHGVSNLASRAAFMVKLEGHWQ